MKNKIKSLIGFLILHLEVALIFGFIIFLTILVINILFYFTGQPLVGIWAFIQISSGILAFFILIVDIYDRLRQKNLLKHVKNKFQNEITYNIDLCTQTIRKYIDLPLSKSQKIVNSIVNEYITSYKNEGRLSRTLHCEILILIPKMLLLNIGTSQAKIFFLTYVFLSENDFPYLQEFVNNLNRNNMYKVDSEEHIFLQYLCVYEKYPVRNESIFGMIRYIGQKDVDEIRAKLLGNLRMYHSIEKLEKEKKFHVKLIKIVDRIMKGRITKHTLSKMSESPRDLLCVIRYKEKIFDKTHSPFNKIFIDKYNFLRPFSKWSIYIKPLEEIPKRYKGNFKLYVKNLIREVDEIWKGYKRKPKFNKYIDIQRGPTYQYLAFKIGGYNLLWGERNAAFQNEFKNKILVKLDKTEIINFLILNKEEVRRVIGQMEIDNLLEDIRDTIKERLYKNEEKIRKSIYKKIGFKITDITSYRKLKKYKREFLSILEPYLGDIDKKEKEEILNSIIINSDDYNKILHELSLTFN